MVLDLIALGILAVFVILGTLRGAIASGASVLALALSYAASWWGARAFGPALAEALGLPAIAGPPVAGAGVFLVSYVVCGSASVFLQSWDRRHRRGRGRSRTDRLIGALFGAVRGGVIVLLLAWLALWLDAARDIGGGERFARLPETGTSAVAAATGQLVESAVSAALSESGPGGRAAARLAARPRDTLDRYRTLVDHPRIRAVRDDAMFWRYVENGAIESALNRSSFWDVVNDVALRQELAALGLIEPGAAGEARLFRAAAADLFARVGPRLKGLRSDPEVQRLGRDPEVTAMLESGDTLGLLRHPGVQKLVSRLAEGF